MEGHGRAWKEPHEGQGRPVKAGGRAWQVGKGRWKGMVVRRRAAEGRGRAVEGQGRSPTKRTARPTRCTISSAVVGTSTSTSRRTPRKETPSPHSCARRGGLGAVGQGARDVGGRVGGYEGPCSSEVVGMVVTQQRPSACIPTIGTASQLSACMPSGRMPSACTHLGVGDHHPRPARGARNGRQAVRGGRPVEGAQRARAAARRHAAVVGRPEEVGDRRVAPLGDGACGREAAHGAGAEAAREQPQQQLEAGVAVDDDERLQRRLGRGHVLRHLVQLGRVPEGRRWKVGGRPRKVSGRPRKAD